MVTWKGMSMRTMYNEKRAFFPRNRNRAKAQAAGAPIRTCPSTTGNTWRQEFQNMAKNWGVSSKSST